MPKPRILYSHKLQAIYPYNKNILLRLEFSQWSCHPKMLGEFIYQKCESREQEPRYDNA